MRRDPLGLAAYGTYGRRFADGGGVGGDNDDHTGGVDNGSGGNGGFGGYGSAMGNGDNVGVADGATPAHDVGPGIGGIGVGLAQDAGGAPAPGFFEPGGWLDRNVGYGTLAGTAAGMLGAPGLAAQGIGMAANGLAGHAPSGGQIGAMAGGLMGLAAGPMGSAIGSAAGYGISAMGGFLGAHGDTMDQGAAAGAAQPNGSSGGYGMQGSGLVDYTTAPAAAQPMVNGLARGGVAHGPSAHARLAHGSGLVPGASLGRADAVTTSVAKDSYVVPADVVSGLGQGNTLAGGKTLHGMIAGGFKPQGFAHGGAVSMTPVKLSGGEFVVHPAHCAHIGGGDVKQGHAKLDKLVSNVRQNVAMQALHAPPPK